jgi:3,4-dihydroxy 2-butanone 4-phosphate synthase/GTP cyclohydrolase II
LVERISEHTMQTAHGEFNAIMYRERCSDQVHLALVRGEVNHQHVTAVRVHEPFSVLDVLDIGRTTHSLSVHDALAYMAKQSAGVVVLLNCGESAARLADQFTRLDAAQPVTQLPAKQASEWRLYGIGAQILKDVGVQKMTLLGSPRKMPSMSGFDLEVVGFTTI